MSTDPPPADRPTTLFERMMAKPKPASRWRVEQLVTSGLGTSAWLPVGELFEMKLQAEIAAKKLKASQGRKALPTRIVEVQAG